MLLAQTRLRKSPSPLEQAPGTQGLILSGIAAGRPGHRVPSSFKGNPGPAEVPGGEDSRKAGPAPAAAGAPRCQTSEARGGFGLGPGLTERGSAEPGASGNRAGISWSRQLRRSAPETTCRTKGPGLRLEGERIRGERTAGHWGASPGPGNLSRPPLSRRAPPGRPGDRALQKSPPAGSGGRPCPEPGPVGRACRPGAPQVCRALAGLVSATLGRPRGQGPAVPTSPMRCARPGSPVRGGAGFRQVRSTPRAALGLSCASLSALFPQTARCKPE